ncbi:MAG TPA: hypothetical protein VFO54_07210 [Chryseosolibacter sp.]|nr:hypothetical protein [Chryseosolibacter sp.]
MKTLLIIGAAMVSLSVMAQTAEKKSVVIGSRVEKPNALLIVNPRDSDQGVLLPQLTTGQRNALKPSSPSEDGLIVFDTNSHTYYYWSEGAWVHMDASNNKTSSYYTIDPVNFQGAKANKEIRHENAVIFESDNSFVTASRDGLGEHIIAPVSLPHGAVIQEFAVYYLDDDSNNISVYLMRKDLGGTNENIISWQSSGTDASIRRKNFNTFNGLETIDLENYTYRVLVIFDINPDITIEEPLQATQRIYGIKIKYQP